MPSPAEVLKLYRTFLKEGKKFTNYNVREYTLRRAKESFRENAGVTEAGRLEQLWEQAQKDLATVQRQVIVYSLYARKQRSVMDVPLVNVLEKQAADTAG